MTLLESIHEQVQDMGEQLGLVRVYKSWASADLTRQAHIHFEVHRDVKTPNMFQGPKDRWPCFDITIQTSSPDQFQIFLRRLYPGFTMGYESVQELRNALIMILKDEL